MGLALQSSRSIAIKAASTVVVVCIIGGCIGGYSIAMAGSAEDASIFGIGDSTIDLSSQDSDVDSTSTTTSSYTTSDDSSWEIAETLLLQTTATRDITTSVEDITAAQEAARLAAEEAARQEEAEHIEAAQTAMARQKASVGIPSGLSSVDWTVGKEAFISEWSERIDAYLYGSPLYGYGAIFAEAAWEYGVDPRFSPAIANTESTKGRYCFASYNAWGWMSGLSWNSWEEAIWDHVAGLADGYGYTISEWAAAKYCPPTWEDWYSQTLYQMTLI